MNRQPKRYEAVHRSLGRAALLVLALLGWVLSLALSPGSCLAQKIELQNLVVDNQAGSILVRFGLKVEDKRNMQEALGQGEALGLRCKAVLLRNRTLWLSETVAEAELLSHVSRNPLSGEYSVVVPGRSESFVGTNLGEALVRAWQLITLDLGPWSVLEQGQSYSLRLEIRVDRIDVPQWLKRSLFFWPWDFGKPVHYQLDFSY